MMCCQCAWTEHMNALLACLELDMGCCCVLPDACRRRMEWCVLQLSVRVSPSCVRPRVKRGGGERLSPRHNAYRLGAEGSVQSVATRAALVVVTSSRNLCRARTGRCAAVVVSAWLETASSDNEMACSHIFEASSGLQAHLGRTSMLHARARRGAVEMQIGRAHV